MNREGAKQELGATARLLLDAMGAERRMTELRPEATLEEAEHVRQEAERLRAEALARFKTCCWRLAVYAKGL